MKRQKSQNRSRKQEDKNKQESFSNNIVVSMAVNNITPIHNQEIRGMKMKIGKYPKQKKKTIQNKNKYLERFT